MCGDHEKRLTVGPIVFAAEQNVACEKKRGQT